jgi:hypothetical protein
VTLPTEFLLYIAELLERLGIPYHVGGSIASSIHGMYRASADIDVVIDPSRQQMADLARALESEFYVSRTAIEEALSQRSTFNAIHDLTSFKIDFFIKGSGAFDDEELRRSVRQSIDESGRSILLKSPEDTVLRKLEWFRNGGEVSERQWQDAVSILATTRGQLDQDYLQRWAGELRVSDLLERAQQEADNL